MKQFIVIDGLDGSGKATQTGLLESHYQAKGIACKILSFPNYQSESSALVKMYLHGEIAQDPGVVNAYAAASFYACDRYIGFLTDWEKDYKEETMLLADRYVSSNAIHQMAKLPEQEWDSFLAWLEDYEYQKMGLPRPSLVLYLDMDPDVSAKLLSGRYQGDDQKKDIHESNRAYLISCHKAAMFAAKKLHWTIIRCDDGKAPFTVEEIAKRIRHEIEE